MFQYWPNESIYESGHTSIAVVDLNHDGKIELLTGHKTSYIFVWNVLVDSTQLRLQQIGNLGFPFGYQKSDICLNWNRYGARDLFIVHPELPSDIPSFTLELGKIQFTDTLWIQETKNIIESKESLRDPAIDLFNWGNDEQMDLVLAAREGFKPNPQTELIHMNEWGQTIEPSLFTQFSADSLFHDPVFVDINNDSSLDLFIQRSGKYRFYENMGSISEPVWQQRPAWIDTLGKTTHHRAEFGDLNRDGLMDILFGETDGSLTFFENSGTSTAPKWKVADHVFHDVKVDSHANPVLFDMDFDADLDLIVGDPHGRFSVFRNDVFNSISTERKELPVSRQIQCCNYPNPFNSGTTISYELTKSAWVELEIHDIVGRCVETLICGRQSMGLHSVRWHAGTYPSGLYFYKLRIGKHVRVKKCMLIK